MKTIICCLFLLLVIEAAWAQSEDLEPTVKRNTVFVELGGPLTVFSINYDRRLRSSTPVQLSVQGGLSAFPNFILLPATFNGFIGTGNHHFNVGVGMAYNAGKHLVGQGELVNHQSVNVIGRTGYRLQKPQGGFFLSVAYTPYIALYDRSVFQRKGEWTNWFGVGLGRTF